MNDNLIREYLKIKGYEHFDRGGTKEGLAEYLREQRVQYHPQPQSAGSPGRQSDSGNRRGSAAGQNIPTTPIITQQKSGLDFWDIMFFSWLFNRGGNTTHIHNYNAPATENRSDKSDDSVLRPLIKTFGLVLVLVIACILTPLIWLKIKKAKLENSWSVPVAIGLGILLLCASITSVLLLSNMVVPNLEHAMGLSKRGFTAFQVIIGLNAVIFGLGTIAFAYLAIDKVNKKSLVDNAVEQILRQPSSYYQHQPNDGTVNNQPWNNQEQTFQPSTSQGYFQAPPPYTPYATNSYPQNSPTAPPCTMEQDELYYYPNAQFKDASAQSPVRNRLIDLHLPF